MGFPVNNSQLSRARHLQQVRDVLALLCETWWSRPNPINIAKEQSAGSQKMVERILHQEHHLGDCCAAQKGIKARILSIKRKQQDTEAKNLTNHLPSTLRRSMELSQEKTWLTALPIDEHWFALHKSPFRDALSLRYGWSLQSPPSH